MASNLTLPGQNTEEADTSSIGRSISSSESVGKKVNASNDEITAINLCTYRASSNAIDSPPQKPKSIVTRMMHSFRRREDGIILNALGEQVYKNDPEKNFGDDGQTGPGGGPITHDTSRLNRKLKGRHMQMIAIGGAIGTGLFIGSGSSLATGGPAALIVAFGIIGVMLFCVIHALGELAVMFPISGIFNSTT
jgi:amino acid permease